MIWPNYSSENLYKVRLIFLVFILFIFTLWPVSASDSWQKAASPSWVNIEIPPGWSLKTSQESNINQSSVTIRSISPDISSELVYILDYSQHITTGEMESFQNQWMEDSGYRICRTKNPVIRTKSDHSEVKQVFVQGTDKGAVMYSADYPGWGNYHVALLMDGKSAVEEYYETLPQQVPDHIVPIINPAKQAG